MKLETFFDDFEVLADAPNGVKKLRELILQLAVRGKLVAQDTKDELAKVLIERLKKEKNIIKKTNDLSPIRENDVPYEIPYGWKWVRLGNIFSLKTGATPSTKNPNYWDGNISWLKSGDVNQGEIFECEGRITEKGLKNSNCKMLPIDSVLIALNGQGKTRGTVAMLRIEAACNQSLVAMISENKEDFIPEYLLFYLKANYMNIRNITGHTQRRGLNMKIVGNLLVALPPSNEQRRIVSKVDQLMSLCDELEARQQKKRETRAHINSAALDRLLAARAPGEFAQGWRCISENFDLLYDAPDNVGALRQVILQLAVRGKLVEQDANGEQASVLLEKIKFEKERLIKEKKIKRTETSVEPSEVPFELPEGWKWISLGNALLKVTDGTHHSPPNYETGDFKYVTAKNIKTQGIDLTNITYVSSAVHNEIYSRCNPEPGDILYIKDGATTGIAAINYITEPFSMLSSVALLKMPSAIYNRYLIYVLRSPYFYSLMRDDMSGVAITRVTLTKLNKALIPLAPYKEQRRIVARVDQLMSLCDELEAGLMRSQADSERLMEAVVGRMLAGGDK